MTPMYETAKNVSGIFYKIKHGFHNGEPKKELPKLYGEGDTSMI